LQVHIPLTADTKQSKGFAYILFLIPEHALAAYRETDGTIFQGRLLHIIPAREKPGTKKDDQQADDGKTFKQKKKAELKSKSTEEYNWNSLFMSVSFLLHLYRFISYNAV
jgi:multiple RNA-binding domain-containing protein 1